MQDHVLLCEEDPKSDLKGELLSPVSSPACSHSGQGAGARQRVRGDIPVPLAEKNQQGCVYCQEDSVFEKVQGDGLSYF